LLPPLLGYYVLALLVCVPGTLKTRLSVLGPILYLAYQAAATLDLALGKENLLYFNQGLVLAMVTLGMRCIKWSLAVKPYRRLYNRAQEPKSREDDRSIFVEAFELCLCPRGCNWNWSEGLFIPQDERPVDSRRAFVAYVALSAISHLLLFDFTHYHIQSFSPDTFGLHDGTIFDLNLPPILRYARSSWISFCSGAVIYCAMQTIYDINTLIAVLLLRQSPRDWPPFFHKPWQATSLTEFWGKRWHQFFREIFVGLGGQPFSLVFGRVGGVMGSFLVSGILHYLGLWGMGKGSSIFGMIGFFLMMGVGVTLEGLFKKVTGMRTEGWLGRIWTFLWLIGWANFLVDAWAQKSLISSQFFPDSYRLAYLAFGPLV
ncbi:hypothetical protein K435DRAFT_652611, partial [Dendrothele bispora CBS 962.96]